MDKNVVERVLTLNLLAGQPQTKCNVILLCCQVVVLDAPLITTPEVKLPVVILLCMPNHLKYTPNAPVHFLKVKDA